MLFFFSCIIMVGLRVQISNVDYVEFSLIFIIKFYHSWLELACWIIFIRQLC